MYFAKRSLTLGICLALLPYGVVDGATFFPGPTPTLIDLYSKAELVVYANVVKTESGEGSQTSHLKVRSVVKADKRKAADEIKVFIQYGSHWPRPFEAKSKTVTFLDFDKKQNMYVPIASLTGLDIKEDATGKFYIKQFAKLAMILAEKDQRKQLLAKVQWYVEVVLFPPSRDDGGFGISALWSRALKAKLLTDRERKSTAHLLTRAQKEIICRTLAKETPNANARRVVDLLKRYPSQELDYYLIQSFKKSMMFDQAVPLFYDHIALAAFNYLPKRLGFEVPEELRAKFKQFTKQRKFYLEHFYDRKEHEVSAAETAKSHNQLIRLWRGLATSFLAIPEVAKFEKPFVDKTVK